MYGARGQKYGKSDLSGVEKDAKPLQSLQGFQGFDRGRLVGIP
jgi:hypothetical protein